MKLFLTSKIWKEGKYYVAYNPELEVASQGKTLEEADKMLKEAVDLFIWDCQKIGTLKQVLEETGFVKKKKMVCSLCFIFFFRNESLINA